MQPPLTQISRPQVMGLLHGFSGATFAMSWFLFADGATFAAEAQKKFVFVMWLPGLLCCVMIVLMGLVNVKALQESNDDDAAMFGGGGPTDDGDGIRARVFFFIAATFGLAGMSIAIWKMADTYNTSSDSWPGVALLLQTLCMMVSSGLLVAARMRRPQEENPF